MSCFAPERAHRLTTTMGSFACDNMCRTMTSRMAGARLNHAADMDTFKACVLGPEMPMYLRKYGDLIQTHFRKLGARASSKAFTHIGSVHAGDLLALRCSGGDIVIAWFSASCECDGQVALVGSQLAPGGAPSIGRQPLAYLMWCNQMACWHG